MATTGNLQRLSVTLPSGGPLPGGDGPPPLTGQDGRRSVANAPPQLALPQLALPQVPQLAPRWQGGARPNPQPTAPVLLLRASPEARQAWQPGSATALADQPHIIDGAGLRARMPNQPEAGPFGSLTYKSIIGKLDSYAKATRGPDHPAASDPKARKSQIEGLDKLLGKTQAKVESYIGKHQGNPAHADRTAAMRTVLATVQRERGLLASLDNGQALPPGQTFEKLLAKLHVGIPADADVTRYGKANEADPPGRRVLGAGACNTVFKVSYNGDPTPKVYKQVLSQDTEGHMVPAAVNIGIKAEDPRYAARNVAASRLDAALGTGLIAHTAFASHDDELGIVMDMADGHTPKSGTGQVRTLNAAQRTFVNGMEAKLADGRTDAAGFKKALESNAIHVNDKGKYEYRPPLSMTADLGNPKLAQQVTNLEWLDMITGEVDRHPGNYLLDIKPNGSVKLTGIDNDNCFGDANTRVDRPKGNQTGRPLLIDYGMRNKMLNLQAGWGEPGGMASQLKGLLTDKEIGAARQRLDGLVDHMASRGAAYVVRDWDTWREPGTNRTAAELLATGGRDGSYLGKLINDAASARAKQAAPTEPMDLG